LRIIGILIAAAVILLWPWITETSWHALITIIVLAAHDWASLEGGSKSSKPDGASWVLIRGTLASDFSVNSKAQRRAAIRAMPSQDLRKAAPHAIEVLMERFNRTGGLSLMVDRKEVTDSASQLIHACAASAC
jgi:hypothetical protein